MKSIFVLILTFLLATNTLAQKGKSLSNDDFSSPAKSNNTNPTNSTNNAVAKDSYTLEYKQTNNNSGKSFIAKLFVSGNRVRLQVPMDDPTAIRIMTKNIETSVVLAPFSKSAIDAFGTDKILNTYGLGPTRGKFIAKEIINGKTCNKYQQDETGLTAMYIWLDEQTNLPVKAVTTDNRIMLEFINYQPVSLDEKLFEIPADYKRMKY